MMYKCRLKILINILWGKGHWPIKQSQCRPFPALSRYVESGKRPASNVGEIVGCEIVGHEKCF